MDVLSIALWLVTVTSVSFFPASASSMTGSTNFEEPLSMEKASVCVLMYPIKLHCTTYFPGLTFVILNLPFLSVALPMDPELSGSRMSTTLANSTGKPLALSVTCPVIVVCPFRLLKQNHVARKNTDLIDAKLSCKTEDRLK